MSPKSQSLQFNADCSSIFSQLSHILNDSRGCHIKCDLVLETWLGWYGNEEMTDTEKMGHTYGKAGIGWAVFKWAVLALIEDTYDATIWKLSVFYIQHSECLHV